MIRTLAQRSAVYLSGLTLSRLLSIFAFILYARVLLPEKFGEFVFFATLVQIITFFSDFGLIQWYQKESHQQGNKERFFSHIIQARFFMLVISLVFAYVITLITGFSLFK